MAAAAQQAQKKKKKNAGALGSTIDSAEMEIPEMFDHAPGVFDVRERAREGERAWERGPEKERRREGWRQNIQEM